MLLYELLLGGTKTPTVTFPTTSTDGVPFSWSISGGQPNEGYWLTTNAADHLTYGSSSSYYGTLDANGNATITGFDFSPNTGTVTVNFIFQYSNNVTKQIVVSAGPAPTVTFPTTQVAAYTFSWSISGGVAGNAYWITTTAPNHLTYGSKASPYGYLNDSGNATITGFSMAGDIGTYSVTFYFYNASTVTKSVTLTRTPVDVTAYRFNSVANNGNTFVAVGEGGNIFRSTDKGVTWIQMTSGVTTELKRVKYYNSNFIAVGLSGTFIYSSDQGITWTKNTSISTSVNLYSVYFVSTRYWICGSNGATAYLSYFTSLSSTTFTQPSAYTSLTSGSTITDVRSASDAGIYFHATTDKGQIWYNAYSGYGSSGGSTGTWFLSTTLTNPPANFNSMVSNFAVGGSAASKTNYIHQMLGPDTNGRFIDTVNTGAFYGISVISGTIIVVGDNGKIYSFPDPGAAALSYTNISNFTISSFTKDLYSIAGNATNNYVIVGSGGTFLYAASVGTGAWTAAGTYI
jgi:photosystem II stability/assembly factor-like uncharacterized protein